MEKKKYKFSNAIKGFNIETVSSEVTILSGDVDVPVAIYSGDFEIRDGVEPTISQEIKNGSNVSININGVNVYNSSNIIINNGINITTNGKMTKITNGGSEELKILIPKNFGNLSLSVNTTSGNVTIDALTFSRLMLESVSGNLKLYDIDVLKANLNTVSGDIHTTVKNSMCNYKTSLGTISGLVDKDTVETEENPTMNLSELNASTVSGNIKVLFKGKNR